MAKSMFHLCVTFVKILIQNSRNIFENPMYFDEQESGIDFK